MFLATKREKPLIAKKNIRVFLYVRSYNLDNKTVVLSDRRDTVTMNTIITDNSQAHIQRNDDYNFFVVDRGAYIAYLWPYELQRDRCLEGYIPAGTEYWVGVDKTMVCAKEIFIKDHVITDDEVIGLDDEISEILYLNAPSEGGVRVGDFVVKSTGGGERIVTPYNFSKIAKYKIKGVVVGFKNSIPQIADIFNILRDVCIDENADSNLGGRFYSEQSEAQNDFCGWEHKRAWANRCSANSERYQAWNLANDLDGSYYIPALGEMEELLSNILFIAAACSIAKVNMPINIGEWFWTSTEGSSYDCWWCGIDSYGLYRGWDYKDTHGRIVPFVASVRKLLNNM